MDRLLDDILFALGGVFVHYHVIPAKPLGKCDRAGWSDHSSERHDVLRDMLVEKRIGAYDICSPSDHLLECVDNTDSGAIDDVDVTAE